MLAWVWILVLLKRYKWPLLLVFYFPLIFKHCIIRLIDNWAIDLDKVVITWFITGFDSFGHFASVVFRWPFIWFRRWWNWLQAVINCANHDCFWKTPFCLFFSHLLWYHLFSITSCFSLINADYLYRPKHLLHHSCKKHLSQLRFCKFYGNKNAHNGPFIKWGIQLLSSLVHFLLPATKLLFLSQFMFPNGWIMFQHHGLEMWREKETTFLWPFIWSKHSTLAS